jgi:conjugative transfer signal peptidase TraF
VSLLVAGAVTAEALALLAYGAGLRVNLSPSLPRGLYRATSAPPRRGSLVLACLPEALARRVDARLYLRPGRCPSGTAPLGKLVAAAGGDVVRVTRDGVVTGGQLLPGSLPLRADALGRRLSSLAAGTYRLPPGTLWLHSIHPRSLDSRYFGPVPEASVLSTLEPFLVRAPGFRMRNRRVASG